MPKLIVAVGPLTVMIRDDRAEMDKATLKLWKAAAKELIEATVDLMGKEVSEDGDG